MNNLLLESGLAIFAVALLIVVIRLLLIKGWKFKFLVCLAVLAITVVVLGGFIPRDPAENMIVQNELQLADESADYLVASQWAYKEGLKAFNKMDYLKAIEYFDKMVPDDPNYRDSRTKMAQARENYVDRLLAEGKTKMQAGDYYSAQKLIDQALVYNSDSTEAKKLKQQAKVRIDALLTRRAAEKATFEMAVAKERMDKWDFGTGPLGIAVRQTKVATTVTTVYGFFYDSRGSSDFAYLWLYVSAYNRGKSPVHVDPDDFTLSTGDGFMASRSESTFSQKYFQAGNLAALKANDGWIIFFVPKKSSYILDYNGAAGIVAKQIVL